MADGRTYDNSGIVSKNKKKEQPKHPDITGDGTIDGVKYWINGWMKNRDDGSIFYSLSFKKKEKQQPSGGGGAESQRSFRDDDDVPF
jgi:hypothetical protein